MAVASIVIHFNYFCYYIFCCISGIFLPFIYSFILSSSTPTSPLVIIVY